MDELELPLLVVIDGDEFEVVDIKENYMGGLALIRNEYNEEFLIGTEDDMREAAKNYYTNIDAGELVALLGEEIIVGMWTNGVSFDDWLDEVADEYESVLSSYDGVHRYFDNVEYNDLFYDYLGWIPEIALRI